jgi:hypothetical protein
MLCADAVKHWHSFSDDLFKEAKAMAPKGVEAVAPTQLSCVIMDNKALSPAEVKMAGTGAATGGGGEEQQQGGNRSSSSGGMHWALDGSGRPAACMGHWALVGRAVVCTGYCELLEP